MEFARVPSTHNLNSQTPGLSKKASLMNSMMTMQKELKEYNVEQRTIIGDTETFTQGAWIKDSKNWDVKKKKTMKRIMTRNISNNKKSTNTVDKNMKSSKMSAYDGHDSNRTKSVMSHGGRNRLP